MGDASSGTRPCAVSAGFASAQASARTAFTSGVDENTEPPAITQSSPSARIASA